MNTVIITELLKLGGGLIDRLFPDKAKQAAERAAAEKELRVLAMEAEQRISDGLAASDALQVEVNKIEAASSSLFKSGWRPATGWVCVAGFSYQFLVQPLLSWGATMYGATRGLTNLPVPPSLDLTELVTMLMGLLGLGAYRTYEKRARVA